MKKKIRPAALSGALEDLGWTRAGYSWAAGRFKMQSSYSPLGHARGVWFINKTSAMLFMVKRNEGS